jgi:plasmid rolling circle replication initiator protein Rep
MTDAGMENRDHGSSTNSRLLRSPAGHQRKLNSANFCRQRLCPMCCSRRALLTASQVRLVGHRVLMERPDLRFVFLTLTVPNVQGERIGDAITDLYAGFQRLWRTAEVKRSGLGYFRALEVKYSRKRGDYHPHLHVLIAVPPRFFKDWYIHQQRWLALWQQSTGNPQITQVDIRVVKPKATGEDKLAGAAAEVGKYVVIAKDVIQDDLRKTAEVVGFLHSGLRGRRLTQYGGVLSLAKRHLKLVDAERAKSDELVAIGEDPSCHCLICSAELVIHVYRWLGGRDGDYVG